MSAHRRPEAVPEFSERYREELRGRVDRINGLRVFAIRGPVTIVYARDIEHNDAVVIVELVGAH